MGYDIEVRRARPKPPPPNRWLRVQARHRARAAAMGGDAGAPLRAVLFALRRERLAALQDLTLKQSRLLRMLRNLNSQLILDLERAAAEEKMLKCVDAFFGGL